MRCWMQVGMIGCGLILIFTTTTTEVYIWSILCVALMICHLWVCHVSQSIMQIDHLCVCNMSPMSTIRQLRVVDICAWATYVGQLRIVSLRTIMCIGHLRVSHLASWSPLWHLYQTLLLWSFMLNMDDSAVIIHVLLVRYMWIWWVDNMRVWIIHSLFWWKEKKIFLN